MTCALRTSVVQAAHAASHSKNTYLASQFGRFVRTKGVKRAAMAVGHSILVIAFHVMTTSQPFEELGADYLDRTDAQ